MLLVCYSLMNSPNIRTSQKQGKMVGYKDTSDVPQKAAEVTNKESNNWPTVSFIPNGREITTYGAELQNQERKIQSNIFEIRTSFFNFKQQFFWISTRTRKLDANSLKQVFIGIYSYTDQKTFLAVHFTKG